MTGPPLSRNEAIVAATQSLQTLISAIKPALEMMGPWDRLRWVLYIRKAAQIVHAIMYSVDSPGRT